jgi:pyruvate dehydrogenase E1 component beta subunit
MREITVAQALNEALREEMRRDKTVFQIGEDIGVYGGWGGVTKDLLSEFGPRRVINTPVSENAIVGAAVGAALAGLRPVAEIMFSDWLTCGMDQTVNFAAMLTYSYGGQVRLPLVIRTTTGHHGGSQHSKSMEAWLTHVPGLKVVMPTTAYDAKGLMKAAIRDDNPVVVFESRHTYKMTGLIPDEDYVVPIGKADVKRAGRDLTVVATGWMVSHALEAANELAADGIDLEVIDPRTLAPFDVATVVSSARKTGRVLIVHEAWRNCGIGAEIAATLYEELYGELRQPIERLAHLDVPHPYSPPLEDAVRPDKGKVKAAARRMVTGNVAAMSGPAGVGQVAAGM